MTVKEAEEVILQECGMALSRIDSAQSEAFVQAVMDAEQVFFVAVGRVFLSMEAICKRFAHLGVNAHCVGEITEPAITQRDLLIVGSGSGESLFPKAIAQKATALGAKVAWIGSNEKSTIAELADYRVRIPVQTKLNLPDELTSRQPMTSLFEQCLLLYGDAVASVILNRKQLDLEKLWYTHANLE